MLGEIFNQNRENERDLDIFMLIIIINSHEKKIFLTITEASYCGLKASIGSVFDAFREGNRPEMVLKNTETIHTDKRFSAK